jgi:hypothetical protein
LSWVRSITFHFRVRHVEEVLYTVHGFTSGICVGNLVTSTEADKDGLEKVRKRAVRMVSGLYQKAMRTVYGNLAHDAGDEGRHSVGHATDIKNTVELRATPGSRWQVTERERDLTLTTDPWNIRHSSLPADWT